MANQKGRVLIVDDHNLVCLGLQMLLEDAGYEVLDAVQTGKKAIERSQELVPDLILLDLIMPELDGFEALAAIRSTVPSSKILITTAHAKGDYLKRAMSMGASGFVTKDENPASIIEAINAVMSGAAVVSTKVPLTGVLSSIPAEGWMEEEEVHHHLELTVQELRILRLVARGMDNDSIAEELALSINTVKSHVSHILQKLDLPDRTNVAIWAHKRGLAS